MQIYGGSAAVEALSYGVSSTQELPDSDVILGGEDVNFYRRRRSECSETEYEDADENEETPDQNPVATVNSAPVPAPVPTPGRKRPLAPAAAIPRLIDNKRKHMEKSLSAAQRDQILLNESREDVATRKSLIEAIKDGNAQFSSSVETLSKSMSEIAGAFSQIARCFAVRQSPEVVSQPRQNYGNFGNYDNYQTPSRLFNQSSSDIPTHSFLNPSFQRPENDRRNALYQLPAGIEPENDRADIEDFSDVSPLITSLQPRGSQQF